MLTGQGSEAIAVQAMREGAQNYLVKTALTPDLLHRAILAAIEHASLERKISEQRRQIYAQKLALAETDRLKTAILYSAGAMIIATDRDGKVLTFNPAAESCARLRGRGGDRSAHTGALVRRGGNRRARRGIGDQQWRQVEVRLRRL